MFAPLIARHTSSMSGYLIKEYIIYQIGKLFKVNQVSKIYIYYEFLYIKNRLKHSCIRSFVLSHI